MEIENKQNLIVRLDIKSLDDTGTFTGYGSVFGNTDSYGDIVTKGAFAEYLSANDPKSVKMLWQHDPSQPIGIYESIREDDVGLFVKGRLLINDVTRAKEAYALLKAGAINGLSIGFTINKDGAHFGQDGKRYINSVALWEISVVTFPANTAATTQNIKQKDRGDITTIREFEDLLRDSGKFSNSQVVNIASHGYIKGLQRDAESTEDAQLLSDIRSILTALKHGAKQHE